MFTNAVRTQNILIQFQDFKKLEKCFFLKITDFWRFFAGNMAGILRKFVKYFGMFSIAIL